MSTTRTTRMLITLTAIFALVAVGGCGGADPNEPDPASESDQSALAPGDVVLWASTAPVRVGAWNVVADSSAAGGSKLHNPNAGVAKLTSAAASPSSYFEMTFQASAGTAYHLWLRMRAEGNGWSNDSVFVQFSGAVTSSGTALARIGTTNSLTGFLNDGVANGGSPSGWGWNDNSYEPTLGANIYFAQTGTQTIRIQPREDGAMIDQIVISPVTYLSSAPGPNVNDSTILPKAGGSTGSKTVRYMTVNLYHGKGTDEVYSPTRHADVIAKEAPDIVCTNETDGNLGTDLPNALLARTGATWNKALNSTTHDMIVTRYPIVSSAKLTFTKSLCGTYGAVRATVDYQGKLVTVACTHLDVEWSSSCSGDFSTSRKNQVNELKTWLASIAGPKLIGGDLNASYNTPEILALTSTSNGAYTNSWTTAVAAGTATSYPDNYPRNTTRTRKGDLDHIFHLGVSRVVSAKVPDIRDFSKPAQYVKKKLSSRGCPNYAAGDYDYPEDCFVRSSDHQPKHATFELP